MVGRPPKYPWRAWFEAIEAGAVVSVVAGRDFHHEPRIMRQQILHEARARGMTVQTAWLPRANRFDLRLKRREDPFPWDRWLNGEPHRLLPGIDFRVWVTPAAMAHLVRQAGRRRGLLVRTSITDGTVRLQAFKREASPVG
jgi:hypothetical protein